MSSKKSTYSGVEKRWVTFYNIYTHEVIETKHYINPFRTGGGDGVMVWCVMVVVVWW